MAASEPGRTALAHIDEVLAGRPGKNDHALSQATICLAELRDGLAAEWRRHGLDPGQRKRIHHVNAVITVVLGIHFPLDEVPWSELTKAREWLADVVGADGPPA